MGNIKRVAGVLQGSGCGCGRCSGHFTNKKEIDVFTNGEYITRCFKIFKKTGVLCMK